MFIIANARSIFLGLIALWVGSQVAKSKEDMALKAPIALIAAILFPSTFKQNFLYLFLAIYLWLLAIDIKNTKIQLLHSICFASVLVIAWTFEYNSHFAIFQLVLVFLFRDKLKETYDKYSPTVLLSLAPDRLSSNLKKIILVGSTGQGKSYLGNKILRRSCFKVSPENSVKSCTRNVKAVPDYLFGESVLVIDCPGFEDNQGLSDVDLLMQLFSMLRTLSSGISLFVYCYSSENAIPNQVFLDNLKLWRTLFGEEVFKHFLIVITKKDENTTQPRIRGICEVINKNIQYDFTNQIEVPDLANHPEMFRIQLSEKIRERPPFQSELTQMDWSDRNSFKTLMGKEKFKKVLEFFLSKLNEELAKRDKPVEKENIQKSIDMINSALQNINQKKLMVASVKAKLKDDLTNYLESSQADASLHKDILKGIEFFKAQNKIDYWYAAVEKNETLKFLKDVLPGLIQKSIHKIVKNNLQQLEINQEPHELTIPVSIPIDSSFSVYLQNIYGLLPWVRQEKLEFGLAKVIVADERNQSLVQDVINGFQRIVDQRIRY